MTREEVAALLAYAARLRPRHAPTDQAAADDQLDQWAELLRDVPATAPHPEGRHWDASHAVRQHISTSPYPIEPSDVTRLWYAFRRDILSRHVDPVPDVDPDNDPAYRAALAGQRRAIETGAAVATPRAAITSGGPAPTVDDELAGVGRYVPKEFDQWRPARAMRRAAARQLGADPLAVDCPYEACRARAGHPCKTGKNGARRRSSPHPSRFEAVGIPQQQYAARHIAPRETTR